MNLLNSHKINNRRMDNKDLDTAIRQWHAQQAPVLAGSM